MAENERIAEYINDVKHTLRFSEDGEFRVLLFTDIQAYPPCPCERTMKDMNAIIDKEKPHLVLFAGDNSEECEKEEQLREFLRVMVGHIEEKKIPWAHVYGNHDTERIGLDLTREQQQKVYEEFPYCLSKAGPEEIKGVGNYFIPVYSSDQCRTDPVFAVWGMDSGAYVDDPGLPGRGVILQNSMFKGLERSNYAYMPFTQIQWYFNTSLELEKYAGHKVPGMMYFHMALQELYEVFLNPEETGMTGTRIEEIAAGPLNSGMFAAILERGDIKAVCVGHDHCNDYAGTYCGVCLAYAANIGYDTYHEESMMGGRMFVVRESEPDKIETYMSYVKDLGI